MSIGSLHWNILFKIMYFTIIFLLENFEYLNERITVLSSKCIDELKKQGFSDNQLHAEPFLHLRYEGTDCALMCSASHDNSVNSSTIHGDFLSGFLTRFLFCCVKFIILKLICHYNYSNLKYVIDTKKNLDSFYLGVKYTLMIYV